MSSDQRKGSERKRAESSISRLYCDDNETIDEKMLSFMDTVEASPSSNVKTRHSKPLPFWAWYIIAKVNGIPLRQNEKPICGTFIHIFTFCCALTYVASYMWYVVYDIMSPNTPRDIPGGTVSIFLVVCWCAFGYYCKTLTSRLFFHRRFLKDVRMHSRTVFKINASLLVVILGALITAANIFESTRFFNWTYCSEIQLDVIVCTVLTVSNMFFSVLTWVWHSLVAFVFLSICRTHTIGLRRFIKEIERDSAELQKRCSSMFKNISNSADDIWNVSMYMNGNGEENSEPQVSSIPRNVERLVSNSNSTVHERGRKEISILLAPVSENLECSSASIPIENKDLNENRDSSQFRQMQMLASAGNEETVQTLSQSEILHNYFKLNCRLRFSAVALQRWFASFIALVLLRCSTYLVHWLGHTATVLDVIQFVLPLVLLVVLSAAIAEVNFEGQRVWQCLYPTESRLKVLQFLTANPLLMPIYGFGMTHGTIVTVIFAILVGFVTRIIMTELTEMNQKIQQANT